MPFDDSFNPDDEQNGQSGTGLAPAGGIISGAAKGGGSSGPNAPTSSGNFTNLQSYLDANSDQNFGTKLANNVQSEVDQANQAQQNADQTFRSQVDQNTVNPNSALVNSAVSDPTSFVQDPNNVGLFQQQLSASYNGPSSLQNDSSLYNPAYQATQNAQQAADASKTDGGRFALLNQFFGQPNYTQGEQNLDQFLVAADPNAQQAFQNVQQGAQKASDNWNTMLSADQGYADTAAKNTKQAAQDAASALYGQGGNFQNPNGGAYGDINSQLQNQLSAAQTADTNSQNAYNNYVNQVNGIKGYDPSDVAGLNSSSLGLDPTQGRYLQNAQNVLSGLSLYGIPGFENGLLPALGYNGAKNETAAPMATPEEQAKLAALGQLSGNSYTAPGQYSAGQATFDPSKVESYIRSLGQPDQNGNAPFYSGGSMQGSPDQSGFKTQMTPTMIQNLINSLYDTDKV